MRVQAALFAVASSWILPWAAAQMTEGPGQGGDVPTTLFFHVNGMQDFPINAQSPPDEFFASPGTGAGTSSLSCIGSGSGQGLIDTEYHTFRGYVQPELVDYSQLDGLGPRVESNRGVAHDVTLEATSPLVLYWYLETQATPDESATGANAAPLVVPNVVVQATLRLGDDISINDAAFDAGPILAQGRSAPTTLQPTAPGHTTDARGHHVYEFRVELPLVLDAIPTTTGANVRIDVFLDNPLCSDPAQKYLMPNLVRPHSSVGLRPRLDVVLVDPLFSELGYQEAEAHVFAVNARVGSALGPYDQANVAITVTGPDGQRVEGPLDRITTSGYTACGHDCGHVMDTHYTWAWPPSRGPALPGDYHVVLTYSNLQGSATGSQAMTVSLPGDAKAPGPELAVALLSLAAAGAVVARRSR